MMLSISRVLDFNFRSDAFFYIGTFVPAPFLRVFGHEFGLVMEGKGLYDTTIQSRLAYHCISGRYGPIFSSMFESGSNGTSGWR
jgi:hypothetical protein